MNTPSVSAVKKPEDQVKIGEYAAMQPLSGVSVVNESKAVHGIGHGSYIRQDETAKSK